MGPGSNILDFRDLPALPVPVLLNINITINININRFLFTIRFITNFKELLYKSVAIWLKQFL